MRSVVVFPAPFGPTSPKKDPRGMSRSIPSTATFPSNDFRSDRTETAGASVALEVDTSAAWERIPQTT